MAETMAPMSVAAMGSRLLGLDEERMLDAIGLAYASCSGNVQPTVEGAWSLWTPAGSAAAAGILAIDLAREGFQGPRNPLLGEFGLYRLYFRVTTMRRRCWATRGAERDRQQQPQPARPASTRITRRRARAGRALRRSTSRVALATNTMGAQCTRLQRARAEATRRRRGGEFSIPFTVARPSPAGK
jgi:2-methylcitrate dehydratase PrpD